MHSLSIITFTTLLSLISTLFGRISEAKPVVDFGSSKKVHLTFFEHADFHGHQQDFFLEDNHLCHPVTQKLSSSVQVNNPSRTCIMLFSNSLCRGYKNEDLNQHFVFDKNSTLGALNDNVASFRLCNHETDNKYPTYQNFVSNFNIDKSAKTLNSQTEASGVEEKAPVPDQSSNSQPEIPEVISQNKNGFLDIIRSWIG